MQASDHLGLITKTFAKPLNQHLGDYPQPRHLPLSVSFCPRDEARAEFDNSAPMEATAAEHKVNIAGQSSTRPPIRGSKTIPSCIPIRCVQQSIAMSLRHAKRAFAIAAMLLFASGLARAQEGAAPIPDSSYGDSATSYQSPTDLPMPAPDDPTNPNIVTIPIPGGGDITVDGPDAPSDTPLPNLPGSQWGITQQTPYSHDVGPTLP
jgi:hypothetical protein